MPMPDGLSALFKQKAELVSAVVKEVQTPYEALQYSIDICTQKEICQRLLPVQDEPPEAKRAKIIAAPALDTALTDAMRVLCESNGIQFLTSGLRDHLAGVDIGLTFADYGIAETGTLVLDSSSEEVRLATMISEIHIAILPLSEIRPSAYDLEKELRNNMQTHPNYTAFITGASRTADIERVLALGVHGPLELHILLLPEKEQTPKNAGS